MELQSALLIWSARMVAQEPLRQTSAGVSAQKPGRETLTAASQPVMLPTSSQEVISVSVTASRNNLF